MEDRVHLHQIQRGSPATGEEAQAQKEVEEGYHPANPGKRNSKKK